MHTETWLVTGGLGFVGSNFLERLVERDRFPDFEKNCELPQGFFTSVRIRVVDHLSTAVLREVPAAWKHQVEWIQGDIRDPSVVQKAMQGVTRVIHLAAHAGVVPSVQNPVYDFEVNTVGTFQLLDAARLAGAKHFVFASSGAVVGQVEPPIRTTDAVRPLSPYGASKAAGEAMVSAFRASYGMNAVSLRFGNIFGPRSTLKGSVIPLFVRRALAGEPLTVFGDGEQKRDFLYVGDLCEAIVRATTASTPLPESVYQLARGEGISLNDFLSVLGKSLMGLGKALPEVERRPPRNAEVAQSFYDLTLTERDLHWKARVEFETAVAETVAWYLAHP